MHCSYQGAHVPKAELHKTIENMDPNGKYLLKKILEMFKCNTTYCHFMNSHSSWKADF